MFKPVGAFSGFSVDDLEKARQFYGETLGLEVTSAGVGIDLHLPGGKVVFAYPKGPAHQPATFTILNLEVEDVEAAVDELTGRGVKFEKYPGTYQNEKGIQRGQGPAIAWFTDPAGNILSVIEQ
ncbi:MAG: VOC family protein [Chloroflexi bacterium]|nr:VOC family protein [Chloroflexota bacterium]OJW02718.1 MAG: glyoxalase [Chloroflexi bacterium 54-19]